MESRSYYNVSIYVGEDYPTWEKFKEICRMEGISVSNKVMDFVRHVVSNGPENQARLTSYSPTGETTRANIESEIRNHFLERGMEVRYNQIITALLENNVETKRIEMADRIAKHLKEKGLKVWR
jgi:hypothetical protein